MKFSDLVFKEVDTLEVIEKTYFNFSSRFSEAEFARRLQIVLRNEHHSDDNEKKVYKFYDFVGVDNDEDGKVIFYLSRCKYDE